MSPPTMTKTIPGGFPQKLFLAFLMHLFLDEYSRNFSIVREDRASAFVYSRRQFLPRRR